MMCSIDIVVINWEPQMMIAYSSLFSSCIIERVGEKIGLTCLFALVFAAFLSTVYERFVSSVSIDLKLFYISVYTRV